MNFASPSAIGLTAMLAFAAGAAQAQTQPPSGGMVYTESNSASGNTVIAFRHAANGTLTQTAAVATGGLGTEGGLGNQGALALGGNGRWLFAINAGSDEISVLETRASGLALVGKVSSGGSRPISLTVHGDLLYVLNAGGAGNITGFAVTSDGELRPLAGSTRPLSSTSAGAAQVQFDNEGEQLVVTEKATNVIDTYSVEDGYAQGPVLHASHGKTPFGFAIDRRNHLIVSEAFGGAPNASALSSYDLESDSPALPIISASVPTNQTAACWVVVGGHGRYAYTANTGSGSVTGYRISNAGLLTSLTPGGRTAQTGAGPTDEAVSRNGRLLFVLSPPVGQIAAFEVQADGSLVPAGPVSGLPSTATGLIAR